MKYVNNYMILLIYFCLFSNFSLANPCATAERPQAKEIIIVDNADKAALRNTLRQAIEEAINNSKLYASLAEEYFSKQDFEAVKLCTYVEHSYYPIVRYMGAAIRVIVPIPAEKSFDSIETLKNFLKKLAAKKVFEFFKVVPKNQLCSIQTQGLDSVFGGRSGATALILSDKEMARTWDRGKMFFATSLDGDAIRSYKSGFKSKSVDTVILSAKVPISEFIPLNVSYFFDDSVFIAGTKIEPHLISIMEPEESISIAKYTCPPTTASAPMKLPRLREEKNVPQGNLARRTYTNSDKTVEISIFSRMSKSELSTEDKTLINDIKMGLLKKYKKILEDQISSLKVEPEKNIKRITCMKNVLNKGSIAIVYAPQDFLAIEDALKKEGFTKVNEAFSDKPDRNVVFLDKPELMFACEKPGH